MEEVSFSVDNREAFQSQQPYKKPLNFLLLCVGIAVLVALEIGYSLTSKTGASVLVILVTIAAAIWMVILMRSISLSVKDGTIYYKGAVAFLIPQKAQIPISEIKTVNNLKVGLNPSGFHLFIIGQSGQVIDLDPRQFGLQDIRNLLKIIHVSRPDLSIPEFWLDDSISIAQLKRAQILGTSLKNK